MSSFTIKNYFPSKTCMFTIVLLKILLMDRALGEIAFKI